MKQNKYTFICEYKGGTYISQYLADDLKQALDLWFANLDFPTLTDKEQQTLQWKINDSDWFPVPINNVDNVWCSSYTVGHNSLLLNTIKTAID